MENALEGSVRVGRACNALEAVAPRWEEGGLGEISTLK